MYKEMTNPPANHAGVVVFSTSGFVTVGKDRNALSDFMSNEEFITRGVHDFILRDIPFFRKFQQMRLFKQWKYIMRWNFYERKRRALAEKWCLAKSVFSERFSEVVTAVNTIRELPFMDIKRNVTYGKKQQSLLEDKCEDRLNQSKQELNSLLSHLKSQLVSLKQEIS